MFLQACMSCATERSAVFERIPPSTHNVGEVFSGEQTRHSRLGLSHSHSSHHFSAANIDGVQREKVLPHFEKVSQFWVYIEQLMEELGSCEHLVANQSQSHTTCSKCASRSLLNRGSPSQLCTEVWINHQHDLAFSSESRVDGRIGLVGRGVSDVTGRAEEQQFEFAGAGQQP